jgi:hypothetical protein
MTLDDRIVAHEACGELASLYEAYRAQHRAVFLVIRHLGRANVRDESREPDQRFEQAAALLARGALSKQRDATYGARAHQLRRRMRALVDPGADS